MLTAFKLKFVVYGCLLPCAIIGFAACGKRRPPAPPATVNQISILTARQQGASVLLEINLPPASRRAVKQINLYRLNERPAAPAFLSVEEFAAGATQIAALTQLDAAGAATYADTLSNNKQALRLRYSAVLIYEDNRRSAFTNFALVQPFFNVAAAPTDLAATISQSAVRLEWRKPSANLDASTPANLIGYNLYRVETGGEANKVAEPRRLNSAPVNTNFFDDRAFEFGKNYEYFVRAISLAENNDLIESPNSNRIGVAPLDRFAPAAPTGLTIAAAPNRLSLFFAANQEPDVAGYNVYRATNENEPRENWRQINQSLVTTTTFQDLTIESGQKYFYYVRAVDAAGNLSQPSETVSEVAP